MASTHAKVALNNATYVQLNSAAALGLCSVFPQLVDMYLAVGTTTTPPTDDTASMRIPSAYSGGAMAGFTLAANFPGLSGAQYLFGKIAPAPGQTVAPSTGEVMVSCA